MIINDIVRFTVAYVYRDIIVFIRWTFNFVFFVVRAIHAFKIPKNIQVHLITLVILRKI